MRLSCFAVLLLATFSLAADDVVVPFETAPAASLSLRLTNASETRTVQLVNGKGAFSVPAGSEWEVSSGDDAYWFAPLRVKAGDPLVNLAVWPTATIQGHASGKVSFVVETLPVQSSDIPRGTKFDCASDDTGAFRCIVPAAARHLVLRVPEMTPHYYWDIGLTAGQTRDLGTIALKRGASFSAFLASKTPARARILRAVPAVPSETAARLAVPVAEAEFDQRGFVQLAPLPAGTYNLEIRAKGFARRLIGPLDIYEGKETSFRKAIELFPPLQVSVNIDPPHDVDERPWRIRWDRVADFAPPEAAITTHSDASGRTVIADQSPGLYALRISDAEGNPLWQQDVRVDEGVDVSVAVKLDLHIVRGKVRIGETPLQSTLWFGTEHGSVRARTRSDEEGAFKVRLPRLGTWPVEVIAGEVHSILEIDVQDALTIEVPDTAITGWVVDANGERLPRARVIAGASRRAWTMNVNAAGEFTLRGLPEGTAHLVAESGTGDRSTPLSLQMKSGAPLHDVELRIAKTQRVAGSVFVAGQPVVAAQVSMYPWSGRVAEAVTDASGHFEVRMADSITRARVVIGAPGRTLHTFEAWLTGEPLRFDIAPAGGTLDIRFTPSGVARDGIEIPMQQVLTWVLAHGIPLEDTSHLRIPDLAPGAYRACNTSGQCATGILAPGATLELRLAD